MTDKNLLPLLTTPQQAAQWLRQHASVLRTDSRKIQPGDAFVAWPGAAHDARAHVLAALERGAAACLVEAEGVDAFDFAQPQAQAQVAGRVAAYVGLKRATALVGAEFYGHPSDALAVIAATGTNGKTSTAWWLAQALSQVAALDGRSHGCGLVGTLGVGRFVNGQAELSYTGLTTPDPVLLQGQLRQFVQQGVQACVMEASSIGIAEHRLDGTHIRVALFTNFTQDHLDYHGSMQAYWQAKRALFDWEGLQAAVINVDDAQGEHLAQELAGGALDVWTVSCEGKPARLEARDIHYDAQGLVFTLVEEGGESQLLRTALIGQYNVANMLGVLASLRALQVPLAQAVPACSGLLPVPGRMECLTAAGQPLVAVDYAHTSDAIEKALEALRPLAQQRGGQLWCVFGCGGDRDPAKRPLMAQAAERGADRVVVTSDNPRTEDPKAIIAQVLCGLEQTNGVLVQVDRALAIAAAVQQAAPQDVVLVAGKGHEDYQEINGQRTHFSDQEHVQMALDKRAQQAREGATA